LAESSRGFFEWRVAASGRKRTLEIGDFGASERPVSEKADINVTVSTDDLRTVNTGKIQATGIVFMMLLPVI